MGTAILLMTTLWAAQQFRWLPTLLPGAPERIVDTLWFALIGSLLTVAAGTASRRIRTALRPAPAPAAAPPE